MAKISIHIPDDVLDKVREHKDSLNISRICSSALLKEVELIADVPSLVQETRKLISRLRSELHDREVESFDFGVQLAEAYLSRVSHDQLMTWGSLKFSEKKTLAFPEDIEDHIEKCELDGVLNHRLQRAAFTRGWLSVMKQSWETVKDKL